MFKVLRKLESYEFAASSKRNFIINRLVHSAAPSGRWCGGQRPLGGGKRSA